MKLLVLWLHLLGASVWLGGLAYQAHVLRPLAGGHGSETFAAAAARARPVTWTAIALVVLTGFYNVTTLGPLARVMESGAGLLLAGKFILVLLAVALAGQRDFAHVPRLRGADAAAAFRTIAWLDRVVLGLGVIIIYLGLAVSRA
ncbi:MAG TPA: CopD family protein [Methylomirabilota bacterium]